MTSLSDRSDVVSTSDLSDRDVIKFIQIENKIWRFQEDQIEVLKYSGINITGRKQAQNYFKKWINGEKWLKEINHFKRFWS